MPYTASARKGFRHADKLWRHWRSLVDGTVVGDGSVEIDGAATLLDAGRGDITLVDRNEKAERLAATRPVPRSCRAAFPPKR